MCLSTTCAAAGHLSGPYHTHSHIILGSWKKKKKWCPHQAVCIIYMKPKEREYYGLSQPLLLVSLPANAGTARTMDGFGCLRSQRHLVANNL